MLVILLVTDMVRVLTVIDQYWPYKGGAENIARFVVESSNTKAGVSNSVLTVAKRSIDAMAGRQVPLVEEVNGLYTINRFRLARIGNVEKNGRIFRFVNLAKYIWNIISLRNQFDIIHAHTFYWSTAGSIIAGKILRKPVIITGHSTLTMLAEEIERGAHPGFLMRLLKYGDRYIAINGFIEEEASRIAGIDSVKVEVICNGIDIGKYKPPADSEEKRALRKQLGLPDGKSIIIYHGRFEDYKNLQTLLTAVAGLKDKGVENVLVLLVGNGPYQDTLESLTEELDICNQVQFVKFNTRVNEYLRASDIYCLPSCVEGLSLSLLEAMASGLVCMASDIDGNKGVLDDGVNGFIFDHHAAGVLTNILDMVISQCTDGHFHPMGQRAREKIEQEFSIESMVGKYCSLYLKMN